MNRIKCLRLSRSLTQAQFAKLLHVDQTAVSNWENEKNNIDIKILETISEQFNVPIEFVIGKSFKVNIPVEKWYPDQVEDYRKAKGFEDLLLFKFGRGTFAEYDDSDLTNNTGAVLTADTRSAIIEKLSTMTPDQLKNAEQYIDFLASQTQNQ